jgi:hypothetical protein
MVLTYQNECLQTTLPSRRPGCHPIATPNFHHQCIPGEISRGARPKPMHGGKYRYAQLKMLMGEDYPERLLPTQQYP